MSKGVTGRFVVEQDHCTLEFDGVSPITIDYNSSNWLPTATSRNLNHQSSPSVNLSVTSDENQNLSPAKKRLLHWHARFGHRNLRDVQLILRNPPFGSEQFLASSKIYFEERPLCEICQYAKARKAIHGKTRIDPAAEEDLKKGQLRPGVSVSVDHFESRIKGRTFNSFGQSTSEHFVGGCVFVDHMSGYL